MSGTPTNVSSGGSEKAELLAPYPNYVEVPAVHAGFIEARQAPRRSFGRRLLTRAVHALLLFTVIAMFFPNFMRGVGHFSRSVGSMFGGGNHGASGMLDDELKDCIRVVDWNIQDPSQHFYYPEFSPEEFPHGAVANIDLPISSDLLYLVSRGALSNGFISVTADGDSDKDVASVEVTAVYHNPEILDKAKVCLLQRAEGKNGVGIFTPEHWHHHPHNDPRRHRLFFSVKVKLPAPSGRDLLQVKGLETHMPTFMHLIDELEGLVDFKTLSLHSSNQPIYVKSVFTHAGHVSTSNGPIVGNFSTSDSLTLRTSNTPINVNVTLINGGNDHHETQLDLQTSNGIIGSNLTLLSAADDHTGGKFKVNARTSNGPLEVSYFSAPVDSILKFEGHTSNSPARAVAHKTFEGSFFLRSSTWFPVTVDHDDTVEDPAGKGRQRAVQVNKVSRGVTEGTVAWLPTERKEVGSIVLTSSNSPVHLAL